MTRKWIAGCIAVLMIFAAGNASAMMSGSKGMSDGMGKGEMHKGIMADDMAGHFVRMVHLLDLTDEQKKSIEVIYFAHRKTSVRKAADIDVAEIELQEILASEPVKMEEAEKKIRAIANFRADFEMMQLKMKEAVKAALTPEQLEKLSEHMTAKMKDRMEKMGGMGKMDMKKDAKTKKQCMDNADASDDDDEDTEEGSKVDDSSKADKKDETATAHH